jgi:hypothetical protein
MRLPGARVITASAVALAMGIGVPAVMVTSASAATTSRSVASATTSTAASQLTSAVTGTFSNADGKGTFAGTFTPTSFSVVNGVLEATGLLKGTMTDADGTSLGTVSQTTALPVDTSASNAAAHAALTCNVLHLVLGPLNLDLLGLVVTLNEVDLNITAVTGSLLGDLLCDVANLLNGGGLLTEISTLLNEILAAL